jgi:uncharacterized protein
MRNISKAILIDLDRKFVFLAGPRQVGKTYLSKHILKIKKGQYYNWDATEDRVLILKKGFLDNGFVVLDELHKYPRWKSWIKGIYDKHHDILKILVTGSAKLDVYRKEGDSLLGRYFLYHLHPFSLGELTQSENKFDPNLALSNDSNNLQVSQEFESLWRWGGFPEPLFQASETEHNRWSLQRKELLIKEDLRDLTQVKLISLVEHLYLLLTEKVGGVLSMNSLKLDLQVSYNTVRAWLDILERLYIVFRIKPFTKRITRSIHKETKLYFWDWSQIKDPGDRFENFIASHLWKATQVWTDMGKGDFKLNFLRDRDRREVDFCITLDNKPWLLVEAKSSQTRPSEHLEFFSKKLSCPGIQVVKQSGIHTHQGSLRVISADQWLQALP